MSASILEALKSAILLNAHYLNAYNSPRLRSTSQLHCCFIDAGRASNADGVAITNGKTLYSAAANYGRRRFDTWDAVIGGVDHQDVAR